MKKRIVMVCIIVFVFILSVLGLSHEEKLYAKTAQMHIEVPDSIKKENTFDVKVVLDSDVALYSIDAYLSYDETLLEFVSDSPYVTGANGILELKDSYSEETKYKEYVITFKALDLGKVEIALTEVYLIDYEDLDYITVTPSAKQFEIGINKMLAEDARLSELIVAPGSFTEEFHPDRLQYEMHVGLEVETVGVSAIPMHQDSVVGLEMPERLQIGENTIKITVTALSGNVNEYVVIVIREELQESSDLKSVDDIDSTQENSVLEESTSEETLIQGENTEETTTEEVTEESTTEETVQEETTQMENTEAETESINSTNDEYLSEDNAV